MRGCGVWLSQAAAEIVTEPKGDPPVGGSKMAFTMNASVVPFANVTWTGEPSSRSWSSANESSTNTPFCPSCEKTSCDPSFQSIEMTCAMPGSTAVAKAVSSNTSTSPVRTLPIAVTPGAFAAASAASIGIGEKLFCAVIA